MNKILLHKLKEALLAVLPITIIILVLNFAVSPMDSLQLVSFVFGAFLLILGMGLYSLGCDTAIEPIGGHIGAKITESRKIWLILIVCPILGVIVTIAEPDLSVLAAQVDGMIGKWELILAVAFGVGLFMIVSVLRTVLKISLNYVLIFFYGVLFLLAAFSDAGFIPLAFDSGGVTTGPITVPFIMALGVGISAVLGGKNSQDNSFGMIGICSIGPIIAVLILGLVNDASSLEYTLSVPETFSTFGEVMRCYAESLPHYLGEVAIALAPIVGFFLIFQIFVLKLHVRQLLKIIIGILYTYIGLSIFLTGVNVGFMPAGQYIGGALAKVSRWLIIPVGMVVGACIVLAEPAVHVLNKQVEEICGKSIIHTIQQAEPVGPKNLFDVMVIAPCTGNTIGKLANAITDTPVTMAAKASLRNDNPLILAVSTNDALSGSAKNIGLLMNTKNIYFVPMRQDDYRNKPNSLVADFSQIGPTIEEALQGKQIQPIYC